MPDDRAHGRPHDERSEDERAADHAAIDHLADELLPALAAKLSATGLGEIEVREGAWKIRVRRPAGDGTKPSRRNADRASRTQPGHAGHGHTPAGFEGHRSGREGRGPVAHSSNGSAPSTLPPIGPDGDGAAEPGQRADRRAVATSPAVGVYQPRTEVRPGMKVRSGDRLGAVDMLGVAQEVVAPADGLVGASLVEAGQAVEYGQELVLIELSGDD